MRGEKKKESQGEVVAEMDGDAGECASGAGAHGGKDDADDADKEHLEVAGPELVEMDGAEKEAAGEDGRHGAPEALEQRVNVAPEEKLFDKRRGENGDTQDEPGGSLGGEELFE